MRRYAVLALVLSVTLLGGTTAQAGTIVMNTAGGSELAVTTFAGESVTTPAGPGWVNLQFAFLDHATPVAKGDLYLLTSEYLGAPRDLSSGTPGFLAVSTGISAGMWVFPGSVMIAGSTQYWFYSNAQFFAGDITGDGNVYPGGNFYHNWLVGAGPEDNFEAVPGEDADFLLTGTPAVPEPGSMLLLGTGLVGLGRAWKKRRG